MQDVAGDARNIPGPIQRPRPPFMVAANGSKGMELAMTQAERWVALGSLRPGASAREWWAVVGAVGGSVRRGGLPHRTSG
jgi:alkanesulfonate monooxygenase SsuD/methylene tetrahydromethanopterin reductase-like flavin-dependent oxidoreductase (luciferase family)